MAQTMSQEARDAISKCSAFIADEINADLKKTQECIKEIASSTGIATFIKNAEDGDETVAAMLKAGEELGETFDKVAHEYDEAFSGL